jgi:hypothetical protein
MAKRDMKWIDAIEQVLRDEKEAMHYTEIAEQITERGYRQKVGATPAATVSSFFTQELKENPSNSIFARVGLGEYILKEFLNNTGGKPLAETSGERTLIEKEDDSIIEAFGIYWDREKVLWKSNPDMFGQQHLGSDLVNFSEQIGIYLLHDGRETIYVGQAIEQSIGRRLNQHTADRLSGRWDRFSWYGFLPVKEDANLDYSTSKVHQVSFAHLGDTLEAILIESLEPRQNRKKGNSFAGLEYIQAEDPAIKTKRMQALLRELGDKI